ncbi:MAG: thermonuclease family protein [Cypionkella sp.]
MNKIIELLMDSLIPILFLAIPVLFWLLKPRRKRAARRTRPLYRKNDSAGPRRIDWSTTKQPIIERVTTISGRCWVVDGDTIVIDGVNIRLAGIDAPEMDHPYGENAKWALVNLTKGQAVTAEFYGEQSYAREVATCYLSDGRDLSAEMVKAGMAIDWPKFSRGKYRHLEVPDARKKMWRADARQKGRMLQTTKT